MTHPVLLSINFFAAREEFRGLSLQLLTDAWVAGEARAKLLQAEGLERQ